MRWPFHTFPGQLYSRPWKSSHTETFQWTQGNVQTLTLSCGVCRTNGTSPFCGKASKITSNFFKSLIKCSVVSTAILFFRWQSSPIWRMLCANLSTRETEGWISLNNNTGYIVWRKDEKSELQFLSFQGIKYNTGHVIYLQQTGGRWHLEPRGHRGQSVLLSGTADYKRVNGAHVLKPPLLWSMHHNPSDRCLESSVPSLPPHPKQEQKD